MNITFQRFFVVETVFKFLNRSAKYMVSYDTSVLIHQFSHKLCTYFGVF